jgi:hypothetical protein
MATITITKTTYAAWAGDPHNAETEEIGEETSVYTVENHTDDFGDWNEDETEWIPAGVIDTAVNLLTGSGGTNFWANEGDGSYFTDEPYVHPYTGEREEQFASLNGFTPDQLAAIRKYAIAR